MAGPVPGPVGTAAGRPAHRDSSGKSRTKEHQMTGNAHPGTRILGSLRSADGKGVVRMEDRFDTDIDDLWSALTDPGRLARWYGQVEGDLRPGGEFRLYLESADLEGTGRVEAYEPPRRLLVTTRETDESWRKGRGAPPFDEAGWQIHAENLAAYLAGRERGNTEARWDELVPPYQDLAANIG